VPFAAANAFDVAADGTTTYVLYEAAGSTEKRLGIVGSAGGAPTPIAAATGIALASFQDTVFYAVQSGSTWELHQRTGSDNDVLGSVTSVAAVTLAGNATDLYVLGGEAADTSTLWRFARASTPGTAAVVATVNGAATALALGATVAGVTTSSSRSLVSIPGPSTPSAIPQGNSSLAFAGDEGFVLHVRILTSNATEWKIDRVTPTEATIHTSSAIIRGGYDELTADANRLYYRVSSSSLAPGSVTSHSLLSLSPDGTGGALLCGSWPSDVLRLSPTHLLGLESSTAGEWFVDLLARP
jgi:hypothetical protein